MPANYKPFYRILFLLLLLPLAGIGQIMPSIPTWARAMSGQYNSCTTTDMKVDDDDNIYVTGTYTGKVDFDRSFGGRILQAINDRDIFIAKYNTEGRLLWALSIGGPGDDISSGLALRVGGFVTITGQFTKTMDADPGPDVENLVNETGQPHSFNVSLDRDGAFLRKTDVGGTGTSVGEKTSINTLGSRTTAGWFQGNAKVSDAINFTNTGNYSGLLVQYGTGGIVQWAMQFGQTGDNKLHDIEIGAGNTMVISGTFTGTVEFNPRGATPTPLTAPGPIASFIGKYESNGRLLWVQPIQGNSVNYVSIDPVSDAIYVTGKMSSPTVTFAPGKTLTASYPQDMFIAKYNADGTFAWAKCIGGAGSSVTPRDIAVNNGDVYVTGEFTGNADFDASAAIGIKSYHGQQDIFMVKYDASGNYQWTGNIGSAVCSNVFAGGIAVNNEGDILLAGTFCEDIISDMLGCTPTELIAKGLQDGFLAKYKPLPLQISNNHVNAPAVTNFCGVGNPANITGRGKPDGAVLTYEYKWERSENGVNFVEIAGANTEDYDPGLIRSSTYYRRAVRSGSCADVSYSDTVYFEISNPTGSNTITQTGLTRFCRPDDPTVINGNLVTNASYQWQMATDTVNFVDIPGAVIASYDPPTVSGTTYFRRRVITPNCSVPPNSDLVVVTIYPVITNNKISNLNLVICDAAAPPTLIGTTPTGGDGTLSYQWQSSTNNISFNNTPGATAKDLVPALTKGIIYYRRIVTSTVCNAPSISDVATVNYPDTMMPAINPGTNLFLCAGENGIQLSATGGTTYSWSPAAGLSATNVANPLATPLITTTYTVTISDGVCSVPRSVMITVIPKPVVNAGADAEAFKGNSITLQGQVTGDAKVTYSWSPATYLSDPTSLTPIATPPQDITYTLTATTADKACFTVSDDVFIKVYPQLIVPNVFTPNGDGINDLWEVAALISYPKCEVNVFLKNGTNIFKSIGYTKPWDGKYSGNLLPFGTYYYTIDLKNGSKISSGWIAIIK